MIITPKTRKNPFTADEIADIRARRKAGEKLIAIGATYGCCHTTIRKITFDIPSPPDHYGRGNRKLGPHPVKIPKPRGRPKKILNKEMGLGL